MFFDEIWSTNNGTFNRNNCQYWTKQNPRLLRPRFLSEGPPKVFGYLQEYCGQLFGRFPTFQSLSALLSTGWCSISQFGIIIYLNDVRGDRWIGTNWTIKWAPSSPDLISLSLICRVYYRIASTQQYQYFCKI